MHAIYVLAIITGVAGVQQMVLGAYAIRRRDWRDMSSYHLLGVLLLTASAACTAIDIHDWSYALMQPPFIIAALRAYVTPPARLHSRIMFVRPYVEPWRLATSVVANITLILIGILTGWVEGPMSTSQVLGAAVVSSALAIPDTCRQKKLFFLTFGRLILCVSSAAKLAASVSDWSWPIPGNAAAAVWFFLMAWATWESGRMFLVVHHEEVRMTRAD